VNLKKPNLNIVLILIILGIGVLAYSSYLAGFKASENDMDNLLMTMTLDSNFVTAGLYEELPNEVRKTMNFYIEDTPTAVNDVKLFAQVKYVTIGGEILDINDGRIWNILKRDRIFQRKFEKNDETKKSDYVPNSPFAEINLIDNKAKKTL
jgi:hypothetical protein